MEGKEGQTIRKALKRAVKFLSDAGVADPESEAEYLLTRLLGFKRHELFLNPGRLLDEEDSARFESFIKRRALREPSQYIVGEAEFMGLRFKVTRATLIPRPETELLVEEALKSIAVTPHEVEITIADLCTGSGCIAISLAKMLDRSVVYATDISGEALEVALENAVRHGVDKKIKFLKGDLFEPLEANEPGLKGRFDLIVSNPPYVAAGDVKGLDPEVRDHEPIEALSGGEDGLDFIRRIVKGSPYFLTPGGMLLLEMGWGQAKKVKDLLNGGQFVEVEIKKDLASIERILKARLKEG